MKGRPSFSATATLPSSPASEPRSLLKTPLSTPSGLGNTIATAKTSRGVAITQENSLLDSTARIEGWLARFPMFDWVGGRTSEMSAVGLLPAALQGIDVREMLAGAALMDEANRSTVGTRSALYANDRESVTVTVQEVTPRSVGALVALYE
ncbi:hypothetical protein K1719_001534 [Acacia pycnantha]|nr:hypothetical protein K1719_001534 [Acacia pycnantha]